MSLTVLSLSVFAAVSLGIVGVALLLSDLFLRNRWRISERLREEFHEQMRKRAEQSPLFRDWQQFVEDDVRRPGLFVRVKTLVEQSGCQLSLLQLLCISTLLAGAGAAGIWLLLGRFWAACPAAVAAAMLPTFWVLSMRWKRITRLCHQLPDAFDVMARALRAGQTVPAAFQVVATDFSPPIAEEFAQCYEQQHLGIEYDLTLRDLARRCEVMEVQIFAVALMVNRKVGGNLAELLTNLADMMRKRVKFRGRVRALTGEGRMQASVLTALPVFALVLLWFLKPDYAALLFERPALLAATGASQLVGALWIRKIINFKY